MGDYPPIHPPVDPRVDPPVDLPGDPHEGSPLGAPGSILTQNNIIFWWVFSDFGGVFGTGFGIVPGARRGHS